MKVKKNINLDQLYQSLSPDLLTHCENVANYVSILYHLALEAGLFQDELSNKELYYIKQAVIYHDIGKKMIPTEILNKKGTLTDLERKCIEKHVTLGEDILELTEIHFLGEQGNDKFYSVAKKAISQHHERYDGKGYPRGLKGKEISVIGRMCCLCDFYDALTSKRIYRKEMKVKQVVQMIENEKERMFDPQLVELFIRNINQFNPTCLKVSINQKLGSKLKKESPKLIHCLDWTTVPKEITKDTILDITTIKNKAAGGVVIKLQIGVNLIVRANPNGQYRELHFVLNGQNMLLLENLRLENDHFSSIQIKGEKCWLVFKGNSCLSTNNKTEMINLETYSKSVRMMTLNCTIGDLLVKRRNVSNYTNFIINISSDEILMNY